MDSDVDVLSNVETMVDNINRTVHVQQASVQDELYGITNVVSDMGSMVNELNDTVHVQQVSVQGELYGISSQLVFVLMGIGLFVVILSLICVWGCYKSIKKR